MKGKLYFLLCAADSNKEHSAPETFLYSLIEVRNPSPFLLTVPVPSLAFFVLGT